MVLKIGVQKWQISGMCHISYGTKEKETDMDSVDSCYAFTISSEHLLHFLQDCQIVFFWKEYKDVHEIWFHSPEPGEGWKGN